MDLHALNEAARPLLPLCAAFNAAMFGHSLARRKRSGSVWFAFWMLACLVAA